MRAMARTADERNALVEIKAVDNVYPLYGKVVLEPAIPLADALAERNGVFGAAVDVALLTRLDLKVGDRISVGAAPIEIRAVLRSEPDKLAGGIGFGPRLLISIEALRATGLIQPGSLVRWLYRVRLARQRCERPRRQGAGGGSGEEVSGSRLGNPLARQRLAAARTQHRALHAIPDAGRTDRPAGRRRRRRQCGAQPSRPPPRHHRHHEVARRHRRAHIRDLSGAGDDDRRDRHADRARRSAPRCPSPSPGAFGAILPLPIDPALQPMELALAALFGLLTALAFAIWPLGRAHDIPVSALFRDAVSGLRRLPRRPYLIAGVAVTLLLAGLSIALSYDKRIAAIFVASAAATFVALRLVASLIMWGAAKLPRFRLTALAARHRQHSPAGRADAVGRAVARPRPRGAGDRGADRRQSAPAIPAIAAGPVAGVLLRRHPEQRRQAVRRIHPQGGARRHSRTGADAARAHRLGQRRARGGHEAHGTGGLGAAERPRHHLCRRAAAGLADRRRRNGGRPIIPARRCCRWRSASPTASA